MGFFIYTSSSSPLARRSNSHTKLALFGNNDFSVTVNYLFVYIITCCNIIIQQFHPIFDDSVEKLQIGFYSTKSATSKLNS